MCDNTILPFGVTDQGEQVEQILLDNGQLRCRILTFGATVQSLEVPDSQGQYRDVVLGYEKLEDYVRRDGYLGATVGRVANRIAGGHFTLEGRDYTLAVNNGPNHLHGGLTGFSHRNWQVIRAEKDRVLLGLTSPDGEEGYPGTLTVRADFRLVGRTLEMGHWASASALTVCALTNHSYFNLDGQDAGTVLGQHMQLFARDYLPTDATSIPLGEKAPVAGTPMDFTQPYTLGERIGEPFVQLTQARGYDHTYVVDGTPGQLRPVARAWSEDSGITMEVETTLPGVQLYTANYLEAGTPGKGCVYGPRQGFCLETQFFPDTPNHSRYPSILLGPGELYSHQTRFRFC